MSNPLRFERRHRGLRKLCASVLLVLATTACAGGHKLVPQSQGAGLASPIAWLSPDYRPDLDVLLRWRAAVGSPLVRTAPTTPAAPTSDSLTVVSWNVALGSGDVVSLVRELERTTRGPVVLLLQEAFRSGDDIPASPQDAIFAGFLGDSNASREIDAIADALGYSLYYVPSMRNGAPGRHDEDRGNAILTNLPLSELTAIELPFERQRRVAVAARISGRTSDGEPWSLRLASVHLDNTGGLKRLWIGSEYGRARQARGLREALTGEGPILIGGDFNTWFGFSDLAYAEIVKAYPQTKVRDTRRTFRGLLRLDHVFYRLAPGWNADVARAESARGSDHHPLITRISF